jgi:hypothetical protein
VASLIRVTSRHARRAGPSERSRRSDRHVDYPCIRCFVQRVCDSKGQLRPGQNLKMGSEFAEPATGICRNSPLTIVL